MSKLKKAQKVGKRYINPIPSSVGGLSMALKVLPLYLTSKKERTPKVTLGPFRTDARIYESPPASGLRLTWMGHSSTLIEIDGVNVLVDPVWDKRAAPVEWAGPKRFFEAPLRLEELPRIDVVLQSHDHFDHLGAGTAKRLSQLPQTADARWVAPLGVGAVLTNFGVMPSRIAELDWTDSLRVANLEVTALPARHFSGRSLLSRYESLWASYVLAGSKHRIYYGADSGEWDGFAEIGHTYGPFNLTMLEIGAFDPLWADIHMGPEGAARTFRAMGGTGLMMPIHWGLFDLALHGWREPIESVFAVEGLKLWTPEPGQPTEVIPDLEVRSDWWRPKE